MAPGSRKTRKNRHRRFATTTIPELKKAFDGIEAAVKHILATTENPKERVRKFQESWRRIFGRPVDAPAAEAYLQVRSRGGKWGAGSGKTRKAGAGKQKGGAALAGAPLDFQTRPGIDGAYGSFPQYLSQGLAFYDTINQQGMFKGCGIQDTTPNVSADMGSNKVQGGGGVLADLGHMLVNKPVISTSPPSMLQDWATANLEGRQLGASPLPDQNPLKYI